MTDETMKAYLRLMGYRVRQIEVGPKGYSRLERIIDDGWVDIHYTDRDAISFFYSKALKGDYDPRS